MLSRFLFIICGLALLTVFVITGCQQQPAAAPLAYSPDVNTIVVTDEFISQAIAATGGYEAWINTKKLELDCVVTFYDSDGSFYLTQQRHEIYPWSDSIRISAVEPQGKFVWLLSKDKFAPAQAQVKYDMRNMIYAVRDITTAPVRLIARRSLGEGGLDKSTDFSEHSKPVKMQGLWYYPIHCSRVTADKSREAVYYRSKDTSLIDIIRFVGAGEMESLMVRGYDYRKVKATGLVLPTRIEIFSTNPAGVIQNRLVKIDYYNWYCLD